MPAQQPTDASSKPMDRANLVSLRHVFGVGGKMICLLLCFSAFGAGEFSRTFNYKGFDASGKLLVQGVITLQFNQTVEVKGDWKLQVLDKSKSIQLGLQDGAGKLTGKMSGDTIFLNMNPDKYGNNMYLEGRVTKADIFKINGKWGTFGYVGKVDEGKFEMSRQKEPAK